MKKHEHADHLGLSAVVYAVVEIQCGVCNAVFCEKTNSVCIASRHAMSAGWRVNNNFEPCCPKCAEESP